MHAGHMPDFRIRSHPKPGLGLANIDLYRSFVFRHASLALEPKPQEYLGTFVKNVMVCNMIKIAAQVLKNEDIYLKPGRQALEDLESSQVWAHSIS